MAQPSTVRRLKLDLSDVDRGVYESFDVRLAQHPSETDVYLVTRVLAYALCYEPGIDFSHGLSNADEPALWIKEPDGRLTTWIEVGTPSAERLHRASKACPRVVIFTQHDPELIVKETRKTQVHRAEHIELYVPTQALLKQLATRVERAMQWALVRSDEKLYVTIGSEVLEGAITRQPLDA
jgi:uncharacterized protein YaeQ